MKLLRPILLLSLIALLAVPVTALALEINEIRIDQTSTDNDEYFELAGNPGESLDAYTYIVIGDGTGGSGVIEAVVPLTGQSVAADGFFLVGEATMTIAVPDYVANLNFENSDNVTHMLVSGFTGSNGDDLDTDDDCTLDVTPWTAVIDQIALVEEANPPVDTECYYGSATIGPDGTFVPGYVYRCPGTGEWAIGPFDIAEGVDTPGAANADCDIPVEPTTWGTLKSLFN